MNYTTLNDLKDDYKDGFRCIHAEVLNDSYTLHLKNFSTEKIKMLSTSNLYEISQIKNYLDSLESVTANTGYDC